VAEACGRPILVGADVSDEHGVEQMFDRVMSEYGRLDILVNNAGIRGSSATRCPRAACRT
jgi:NAD(P)-dependent dehydrogenase (short-subunit alcohol dehydrogenase family)